MAHRPNTTNPTNEACAVCRDLAAEGGSPLSAPPLQRSVTGDLTVSRPCIVAPIGYRSHALLLARVAKGWGTGAQALAAKVPSDAPSATFLRPVALLGQLFCNII